MRSRPGPGLSKIRRRRAEPKGKNTNSSDNGNAFKGPPACKILAATADQMAAAATRINHCRIVNRPSHKGGPTPSGLELGSSWISIGGKSPRQRRDDAYDRPTEIISTQHVRPQYDVADQEEHAEGGRPSGCRPGPRLQSLEDAIAVDSRPAIAANVALFISRDVFQFEGLAHQVAFAKRAQDSHVVRLQTPDAISDRR